MNKQLTILVVDDLSVARESMSHFIERLGHIPIQARDGVEALAAFRTRKPDVVLLDVQMPKMDGYTVARHIRRMSGNTWTPIIFLSVAAKEADLLQGFEVGGDDYLTKPVQLRLLAAKIKTLQRIAEMQRQLRMQADQLSRYHDENEREQNLAKRLMDHIVRGASVEQVGVQRWLMPAHRFSGDFLATAVTPSGSLHVILADGTGHGLAAALSVMPVAEIFHGMTRSGFGLSRIVRELNGKMKQLLPIERFVTVTLAAIEYDERTIEIWNCGNPPVHFIDMDGTLVRSWASRHPALGILGNDSFDDTADVFHWRRAGCLYMCSDGLLEAQDESGEAFGTERMMQVLTSTSPEARFGCLRAAVCAHLNGQAAHDDVSIVEIDCFGRRAETKVLPEPLGEQESSLALDCRQWQIHVRLSVPELQSIDIVPLLMTWMEQVKIAAEKRGHLFLILAELFNNALDYGVLELDPQLKRVADGFEKYLQTRSKRLANLQSGYVEIAIAPYWQESSQFLHIQVKDSGRGFDHDAVAQSDMTQNPESFSRGIVLVRKFCESVTYLGNGNEVVVQYRLSA